MKTIEELLKNLARPEVVEFGLVTNRLPSVNIGGKFEPVDDEAPTTERLMQMLVTMGGARHVDSLSDKPVQWTTRLDGVGVIAVAAILRKDIVQARFTVAKRETANSIPAAPLPQISQSVRPPSSSGAIASAARAEPIPVAPPPPEMEEDDDDEPTLQTVSPPVSGTPGGPMSVHGSEATASAGAAPGAAREQPAQEKAGIGRRIVTPTSVDAVDVDLATGKIAVRAAPTKIEIDLDLDLDTDLDTDEGDSEPLVPAPAAPAATASVVEARSREPARAAAAPPVAAAPGALAGLAERDRPRIDPSASIDSFLARAVAARASDLYIVGERPVLLRVASDLLPRTQPVGAEQVERIVKEIVPTRLREALEREGSCDFAVEHPTFGRFRVNVSRQLTGYKLNLRVIPKELPTLETLGLLDRVLAGIRHDRGLVLVTGPASHGKSTTVAALVDQINRERARHIVTIEDPIEFVHVRKKSLVSQRDVGLHSRAKSRAIQSALRDDADVVVIGELRDAESVRLALGACESGRLVLATMNASSAAKAPGRLLDLFAPSEEPWVRTSLASALRLIIGQRLLPSADRSRLHAAVELLPWSVALHGLLREGRAQEIPTLFHRAKALGIVRLDDSIAELVRAQKVTADVAKTFVEGPLDGGSPGVRPIGLSAQARRA